MSGVSVTSWDEIPQADYDSSFLLVSQLVGEKHPELDLRRGAIHDLVLVLHAILGASLRIEQQRMLAANSLLAVSIDPSLADPGTLDRLFSNYLVARQSGQTANGNVTLVLTGPQPTIIPEGFEFVAGSRRFVTSQSYAARLSSSDLLSDADRLLVAQSNGTFTFTIPVTAVAVGTAGLLRKGELLLTSKPVPYLSKVYAADDFVGGRDTESNTEMFTRLQLGVAARGWSTPAGVVALVREYAPLTDSGVSVVGGGYSEMLRDKHSVLPISSGNRVDLWIKSHTPPAIKTINKTATFIDNTAAGPRWRIQITRDDLPGLYTVTDLLRDGRSLSSSVLPTSFVGSYVRADGDPDILNPLEASFSRFQSGTLEFIDAPAAGETLVANVSTAVYAVTAVLPEHISGLQEFLDDPSRRPLAGDVVVRGAVPCFVSAELELQAAAGSNLDSAGLAEAVARLVNQAGFVGAVFASQIASVVTPLLTGGVVLLRTRLSGIVFKPDGTRMLLRDRDRKSVV